MQNLSPEKIEELRDAANKTNFEIIIKPRLGHPDDVYFVNKATGKDSGYGFISKNQNPQKRISLVNCPACGTDNYALNVSSGECTWCPFSANGENR